MTRPTIWITYAWADNETQDVDYVAQQLEEAGLTVKRDCWDIVAGQRLWEQIERFIQDERETDAWLLYATTNSLLSQACREEYAYALERALRSRGRSYPVIGLFPESVDRELIPAGIRTRLFVVRSDPNWVERIKSAVEGRPLGRSTDPIDPYYHKVHHLPHGYAIEFRPRADTWRPFSVALPLDERDKLVWPVPLPGAPDRPPQPGKAVMARIDAQGPITAPDGSQWWKITTHDEATPTKSLYLFVKELPSRIAFGPNQMQRLVSFPRN